MFKKALLFSITLTTIILITAHALTRTSFAFATTKNTSKLTFYVATDIHYLSNKLTDGGEAFNTFSDSGDGKQLKYIDALTDAFVREIQIKKPSFLIVSGDLTNNGEKDSHIDLAKKFEKIRRSGTKVYVIPGNHDVLNPYARGFKGDKQYRTPYISDKEFATIYKNFGYSTAISRDKHSLSYLAAPSDKLWLLMLDTCKYSDNVVLGFPEAGGQLKSSTEDWIKTCSKLAHSRGAKLITVMHHNLLDHFKMLSKDFTIDDNSNVLSFFRNNNLSITLSGHIHIQDIKSAQLGDNKSYDIATSALSVYPHHYGVMTYSTENGFNYTTSSVPVEAWAKAVKSRDKNLIDFNSYSRAAFKKSAYDKSYERLVASSEYTDEEKAQMSDTMAEVNLRIFSGTENTNSATLLKSPGYKLWQNSKSSFLQSYIMNISDNINGVDNNKLHIPNKDIR